MAEFTIKQIDEMRSVHHGAVKLAAAELGVESFGMQVLDLPHGFEYPEHDHADDGMEEVYLVLAGSGEFRVGEERVALSGGEMLRVAPDARRKLEPGPHGVRLVAIGCTQSQRYERPQGFRLEDAS
jgi:mannose-6-phosphate isomerase-like protein (cupin superfamily)